MAIVAWASGQASATPTPTPTTVRTFAGTRMDLPTALTSTAGESGNYYKIHHNRTGRVLSNIRAHLPSFGRSQSLAAQQPAADFTWSGAIEYPVGSGTLYKFAVNGNNTITVPISAWGVTTDAIAGLTIPDGAAYAIYSQPRVTAGNVFPQNAQRLYVSTFGDRNETGTALTDRTANGSKPSGVSQSYGYHPVLTADATGTNALETALLVGDSIGGGQSENSSPSTGGGTLDAYGNIGPLERRFTANSAYLNVCRASSRSYEWARATQTLFDAMLTAMGVSWSALYTQTGMNDFNQNLTAASVIADRGAINTKYKGAATRVIGTTVNPITVDARPCTAATMAGTSSSTSMRYTVPNASDFSVGDFMRAEGFTPTAYNKASNTAITAVGATWVEVPGTAGTADATVLGTIRSFTNPAYQAIETASKETERRTFNAAVRAFGTTGQTHSLDIADAVETARDSGIYKSKAAIGGQPTMDGIHLFRAASEAAAAIPLVSVG